MWGRTDKNVVILLYMYQAKLLNLVTIYTYTIDDIQL